MREFDDCIHNNGTICSAEAACFVNNNCDKKEVKTCPESHTEEKEQGCLR